MSRSACILFVLLAGLAGCSDTARLPEAATQGAQPQLPPPVKALIPTVHIAPAEGWPQGAGPQAPAGFRVTALDRGLEHPRWLYVLPNGDILVAESNAPKPPPEDEPKGLKNFVMKQVI
jgi:glucose/arabinose dehydrogenase